MVPEEPVGRRLDGRYNRNRKRIESARDLLQDSQAIFGIERLDHFDNGT